MIRQLDGGMLDMHAVGQMVELMNAWENRWIKIAEHTYEWIGG